MWGYSVSDLGGPFQPQESVMWSSQLLALLEERERECESRIKQWGLSALLQHIDACGPSPLLPGLQAVCVWEAHSGGLAGPALGMAVCWQCPPYAVVAAGLAS